MRTDPAVGSRLSGRQALVGHGGPRAPRVRLAFQPPCQPPSLASPLLPHFPCQEAAARRPTGRGEEHAGSGSTGASETACAARGAARARGWGGGGEGRGGSEIVRGFRGRNILRHFCRAGWAPASSSPPESRVPRKVQLSHFEDGGLFPQRDEENVAWLLVLSRQEKEDPEGPLFTLRPGWEGQVEPQGFIWQPCLDFPHTHWQTTVSAPCKEGTGR